MAPKAKRKSNGKPKTTPVRPQRVLVIDAGEPFRQVGATLREDQIVALDQVRRSLRSARHRADPARG